MYLILLRLLTISIGFYSINLCSAKLCTNHIHKSLNDTRIRIGLFVSDTNYHILASEQADRVLHDKSFHKYFEVVAQICVPSTDKRFTKSIMESHADIVINSLYPNDLYSYFIIKDLRPSNLVMTTSNTADIDNIILTWSNKGTLKSG